MAQHVRNIERDRDIRNDRRSNESASEHNARLRIERLNETIDQYPSRLQADRDKANNRLTYVTKRGTSEWIISGYIT